MIVPKGNSTDTSPRRIVIADDHVVVRCGIRALLTEPGFRIVAETGDLERTEVAVRSLAPDLLIIDLNLRGTSSLPAIPGLLQAAPAMRLLVLTMDDEPEHARAALVAGAHGYVRKEAATEELVSAIRTVVAGGSYLDAVLGASMATAGVRSRIGLTERESRVLALIARGYTNPQIAKRLHLSLRTVETHRRSVKNKLQLSSRAELIEYARKHRLVF